MSPDETQKLREYTDGQHKMATTLLHRASARVGINSPAEQLMAAQTRALLAIDGRLKELVEGRDAG